jgi:hypothetical protein
MHQGKEQKNNTQSNVNSKQPNLRGSNKVIDNKKNIATLKHLSKHT